MTDWSKPLVLVVDDEPDILTLNRFILEQKGYQVVTAGDGVDAIQKAVDFHPDIIVLDVMMPRMNGYQVCRLLKDDRRTAAIPIIICTVKSLESEKLYAYTSGADHYLVKPFEREALVDLVGKSLDGRMTRHSAPLQEGEVPRSRTSTDSILSDVNRLLDRRLMELTILQNMTRTMSSTLDLDGVLSAMIGSLRDLGFPGCRILLTVEEDRLEERTSAAEPLAVDLRRYHLFSKVLDRNEAKVLNSERLINEAPGAFQKQLHAQTVVLVPIKTKGRAVGLLIAEIGGEQSMGRNQRDFLLTLASQAGMAIESANLYERTLQLSITDGLTSIYNYRYFCERLENELARAKRYLNTLGLIILDIDHFKIFNDQFGHLLGDDVLRHVGRILRENTRDVDVVARYGGEEFGVLLNETDIEETILYAERIREAVEAFHIDLPNGAKKGVTVSLGVAVCKDGDIDEKEFIRRADQALYRAKDLGRNRICVWREEGEHICRLNEKQQDS